MKRTWSKLGFLCLIGLCISCSSEIITDDVVQPTEQAISWVPYIAREVQTRAAVMDNELLKTTGFGIMGYVHTGTPDYATPNFMNGQVTWDSSNSQWSYSPTKYWPNNASQQLDFLAYAPYGDDTHISVSGSTLTFTVDANAEDQVDLVAAQAINQTQATNYGGVNLCFTHLLARLQFKAQAAAEATSNVVFTSAKLTGAPTTGTVDLSTYTWTETSGNGSFTIDSATNSMLLIPCATDVISVTISYTLTNSEGTTDKKTTIQLSAHISGKLEAGKTYTITLNVSDPAPAEPDPAPVDPEATADPETTAVASFGKA